MPKVIIKAISCVPMWFILKKYIFMRSAPRALKVATAITVGGIAISVAVLVVSISVAGGFEDAYKRSILDFNAHIILLKDGGEIPEYGHLINELGKFDDIVATQPFIYRESMLVSKGNVKGVVIKGVDFDRLKSVSNMSLKVFNSSTHQPINSSTAFLGNFLAAKLGINSEASINILIGSNKFQKVSVIGTFESGLYDYDSQFALMPLKDVQQIFSIKDEVTGIEMKLADPGSAGKIGSDLEKHFPYPYQITTWEELNRPIFEAVQIEKIMFAIIIGALALVALFNIIGSLVLKIIYKAKDCSILSAIGMKKNLIRGIFTFHGVMLGITGIFFGLASGAGIVQLISKLEIVRIEPEIYFLSHLPAKLELSELYVICAVGIIISLLVSFIAGGHVSSVNILEGLKEN